MLPPGPSVVVVVVIAFCFPAAGVDAAGDPDEPIPQKFLKQVGDAALFHVDIPKGASFAELFLRTTLKRRAVALWQPGKPLTVLDAKYGGRVSFSEDTHSFNISHLRVADGEIYEVSMSLQEPAETVLNTYRLTVFNINGTASQLANGSCSLGLLCQAGVGPDAIVSYTWKETESGATLARGVHLQVTLSPTDRGESYTCTAQAGGVQSEWPVAPYEQFCGSGVAGIVTKPLDWPGLVQEPACLGVCPFTSSTEFCLLDVEAPVEVRVCSGTGLWARHSQGLLLAGFLACSSLAKATLLLLPLLVTTSMLP